MTPAGTTHYLYDLEGRPIAEADDSGQTLREYVWLDEMPLAVVADVDTMSPQLFFVHADHLDRPVRMTDGSQAVVWDAVYRPFGQAVSITGSASNNLRFPGQYFLLESGLHYNWHRHYDPTTGRYLQPDPLGFVDGPSLYSYALNSPQTYIDPRGDFIWIPFVAAGVTAALWPDIANAPGLGERTMRTSPLDPYIAGASAGFGAAGGLFCIRGREISIGRNWRFAPGGNRTDNPYGRWPHYHRRGTEPGQGIGRHRPWETRLPDRSFWDRF